MNKNNKVPDKYRYRRIERVPSPAIPLFADGPRIWHACPQLVQEDWHGEGARTSTPTLMMVASFASAALMIVTAFAVATVAAVVQNA